jgi:hypothetical protein
MSRPCIWAATGVKIFDALAVTRDIKTADADADGILIDAHASFANSHDNATPICITSCDSCFDKWRICDRHAYFIGIRIIVCA